MNDLEKKTMQKFCGELAKSFKGILKWKTDERFNAVLAEFEGDINEKVRSILDQIFSHNWSSSSIYSAPNSVQQLNSCFGGLLPGQILYTTDPEKKPIICGAWWPWGNGYTISIRISSSCDEISESERKNLFESLKIWFEII